MKSLLILLFYISILGWGFGDSLASKNNEGNKLYKEGKIDEALSKWQAAQIENPDNEKLHYNIGNGFHGRKKYGDAFNEYEKILDSKNSELKQKAYYNIGNTQYRMNELQEAIKSYEKSLEIDPEDEDAKYNIEFIKKKLEEKQKKENEKQENSQQKENKDQEQQSESSQAQEDQRKEEEAQQAVQKSEKDKEKEAKENQEKQSQKEQSGNREDEERPSGEEKKGDMSKEDAVRLLDALKDDEKDTQRDLRNQPVEGRYRVDKDW